MLKTFLIKIAYEGTCYFGWQIQPNGTTIQGVLEEKLALLFKEPIEVTGSGRTDTGVHALGQVAHIRTKQDVDPLKLRYVLNSILPHDIRILEIVEVPNSFHARFSAIGKVYHYHLALGPVVSPFDYRYRYRPKGRVSTDLLKEAAKVFLGVHDFTAFANEASKGSAAHVPIKEMRRVDVVEEDGGVRIEFEAEGFLYKMVRNMVGQMVEVGLGKVEPSHIYHLLASRSRKQVASAAPPQGLFLVEVIYSWDELFKGTEAENSSLIKRREIDVR